MKSFTVGNFHKELNKVLKNATKEQKASVRCTMLFYAIKRQVKGAK